MTTPMPASPSREGLRSPPMTPGGEVSQEAVNIRSARISECGQYRYSLVRRWMTGLPACAFIMLNPSTADATQDDPTIRRCVSFAWSWGYGGITVVNLFALRSTDPKALLSHHDPVGPENEKTLSVIGELPLVVAAWGSHRAIKLPGTNAFRMGGDLKCLGYTKDGSPRHPLYVRSTAKLIPWPRPTQ